MRQLIDECHLGVSPENSVQIHLLKDGPSVFDGSSRHHLEVFNEVLGVWSTVTLHESDDHIGAALPSPMAFIEHGIGLPDPGRSAEIESEVAGGLHVIVMV